MQCSPSDKANGMLVRVQPGEPNRCKYCGDVYEGRRMSGHVTGCQSNPNRYWHRPTEAQLKARNKAKVYAWRARKYNAIVPSSDLDLIKLIYEACPDGYHVDHIRALASGGLHHQDNLQYLPAMENCRKGNGRTYDVSKVLRWQDVLQS